MMNMVAQHYKCDFFGCVYACVTGLHMMVPNNSVSWMLCNGREMATPCLYVLIIVGMQGRGEIENAPGVIFITPWMMIECKCHVRPFGIEYDHLMG